MPTSHFAVYPGILVMKPLLHSFTINTLYCAMKKCLVNTYRIIFHTSNMIPSRLLSGIHSASFFPQNLEKMTYSKLGSHILPFSSQ